MSVALTSHAKPWPSLLLGGAFGVIGLLYCFGLVASVVIPFGPPMSIVAVAQAVFASDPFRHGASLIHVGIVLSGSLGAWLFYTMSQSLRVRLAVPLVCIFAVMFGVVIGPPGPAVLIAVPLAPFYTIGALAGLLDGEFYAEGWLAFIAVGWWIILWCVLLLRELRIWVHEPFAA